MPLAQQTSASQTPLISPAELSYLYNSLSSPSGAIRPDGRSPTQFRFLTAETGILPGTIGSARIGFADGSEAIVGVKAELERTLATDALDLRQLQELEQGVSNDYGDEDEEGGGGGAGAGVVQGQSEWVQMSIEIPGFRDDDALPVFLSEMMRESLVGSSGVGGNDDDKMVGGLKGRLVINRRWHWRLYIDVLLLSPPQSYPLPLLSLTTHLALLSTRLPKLKSQGEEDPFFEDDWNLSEYIYPRPSTTQNSNQRQARPPVTLLVISTGQNVIFDPTREEIAVADAVLAVSIGREQDIDNTDANLKLLSIRTIDPPSRLTQHGVPDSENAATLSALTTGTAAVAGTHAETRFVGTDEEVPGVWKPRRGGVSRSVISKIVKMVLAKGGVGDEVMGGLESVEVS
ncbi:3' exoribonuclease family protein (Rrp42), putative [Talaromyces stipitatus ATCC 10500]|uniref:Ribosomal RNA-processing protein 42 n=1 Tax=Talaromyces stipitatus (strain ATCC 10500 / CBS 375.48 / QM 6759 / NRRL 1006) TaxID=441959 RepID=B8M3M8_TALSN|nr:3' exoribonuclease family protein (Rrp42), putative [Talaromyces stipitatus ATCC 10500]EED22400.1 3' exoribonuclease family protein (Rrp42), putative [Talaromyces stipitatus ATCC 10500]